MIITNPNFRPNTSTEPKEFIFRMMLPQAQTAALGDMIAWMPAIEYVAKEYNFVKGHLVVPEYFLPIARNLMEKYPHWQIHKKVPKHLAHDAPMKCPLEHPINATGMHLVDLGFLYFVGIVPPPEGSNLYPVLDLDEVESPIAGEVYAHNYAVMTPCATTETRKMLPSVFNAVVDHLNKIGVTPVFLGDAKMFRREIQLDDRYDLSKGINLLGKTSLLEAAKIMDGAKFVMGIDNGLLHLAATTDVTILYGFTMTGPEQRRINRKHGHTVELYADKEKLPCLFCQERVRFFVDHHFTNCIYKENEPACVKALNTETWIANIDAVLKEKNES